MHIFLDFDDTIFHTKMFREELKKVFALCGVSEEVFQDSYKAVKQSHDLYEKMITYDFDSHIEYITEHYDVDPQCLLDHTDEFLSRSKEYLFSDVSEFIAWARDQKTNLFLVSYGTSSFQEKKVIYSQIETMFSQCSVGDENKGDVVSRILEKMPDETSWFVDDKTSFINDVKEKNPQVKTILLKRDEARYNENRDALCDFEAKDLGEVKKIILTQ